MRVTVNQKDIPFVPVTIELTAIEVHTLCLWLEEINRNRANARNDIVSDLYTQLLDSKWGGRKL